MVKDNFDNLVQTAIKHYQDVTDRISFFGKLEKELAEYFQKETQNLYKQFQEETITLNRDIEDAKKKKIVVQYMQSILSVLEAKISLNMESSFRDSKLSYLLNLKVDTLEIEDLENVINVYKNSVDKFLTLQKEVTNMSVTPIPSKKVPDYKRLCEHTIFDLDRAATNIFGREIHTPADFDVKEIYPHQFLGQINVGYERYLPYLISTIAHEGPFGHNMHEALSEESFFAFPFRHTQEGLGILGEQLALELYYSDNKCLIDFWMAKGDMNNALTASYEKAAFFDKLSVDEIADLLGSRVLPPELIKQQLQMIEKQREVYFSFNGTPYYVGGQLIRNIYNKTLSQIKEIFPEEQIDEYKRQILLTMYSGQRPARIIEMDLDYSIDKIKREKK